MLNEIFYSFLIGVCICLCGCASANQRNEIWEGIEGCNVRVFVAAYDENFLSFKSETGNESLTINDYLLLLAKQRAVLFITGDVTIRFPELQPSKAIDDAFIACIEKPDVIFTSCDEDECVGLVSFDITPAINFIESRSESRQ